MRIFISFDSMRYLIVAVHGIFTRQTDPSWPDHFDAWMAGVDPGTRVLKKEYGAGPFPRWNCWIKDPRLARGLAAEILLFLPERRAFPQDLPRIWFVAHSNGAVIALLALRRLVAAGCPVAGIILSGAACEADLHRNGVLALCEQGALGAAIAYSAADDAVLSGDPRTARSWWRKLRDWFWGKLIWPYGCLGRTGWTAGADDHSQATTDQHACAGTGEITFPLPPDRLPAPIFTRWFRGGHGTYFSPENRAETFHQVASDIRAHTKHSQATQLPTSCTS